MRVIVTGSRDWTDRDAVFMALGRMLEAARELDEPLVVAHGCAKGADMFADSWVIRRRREGFDVTPERFPADWRNGKSAGVRRNLDMLRPGADACVAFLLPCSQAKCGKPRPHGSHGTTHCAEVAESAGIRTVWADPHGLRAVPNG